MTNEQPKQQSDAGILRDRHWAALVRLWQADNIGIEYNTLFYGPSGFRRSTITRLQYYQPEPLIEYFKPTPTPYSAAYRITDAGRSFYREHWHFYRARYPTVEAPNPNDI